MTKTKNIQLVYASIGIALAFAVAALFVSGTFAESKSHFERNAYSTETKKAIYTAFEDNDYNAYVDAVTEKNKQSILTEEEFSRHAQNITKKQQIHATFTEKDYDTYSQLTDGSIHQLSEAAFQKKASMLALKDEIKAAIQDHDYETFTEKKQALRELLGNEYMELKHGDDNGDMTEEQFNTLADRMEQYGEEGRSDNGFMGRRWKKRHNKHSDFSAYHMKR